MPERFALLLLISGAILSTTPAHAGEPADGKRIVQTWCASCHTLPGNSAGRDTAPPFERIARDRTFDRDQLTRILANPHPPMPQVQLSRRQLDDLVAYLKSLRGGD